MNTTPAVTPETLTFEHIKSWDGPTMRQYMDHPEMREAITNIVKSKSLEEVLATQAAIESQPIVEALPVEQTPEDIAAADAQKKAEDLRVAAEQEAARKAAEPKKFVIDYQVKDEEGNPIGRPTHLEAINQEELIEKIKEAHVQATRAFHRLKKQKVSFKEQPVVQAPVQTSDAELLAYMKDLKSDDPQKQLDAVRKVQKFEAEKVQTESDQKIAELNELRRQEQVSYQFLTRHQKDFNNCEANIKLIRDYFEENELAWTSDNLEISFHALESELAPVVAPVAPAVPANPAPAPALVITAPATPLAVQPVVIVPAPVTPPVNPAVITPRPGVNGGLVPGQSSGGRPVIAAPKGLSVEEIRSWDGPTMRAKMRNPAIRAQIEAFAASRSHGKK
jgi:hypothetical protein